MILLFFYIFDELMIFLGASCFRKCRQISQKFLVKEHRQALCKIKRGYIMNWLQNSETLISIIDYFLLICEGYCSLLLLFPLFCFDYFLFLSLSLEGSSANPWNKFCYFLPFWWWALESFVSLTCLDFSLVSSFLFSKSMEYSTCRLPIGLTVGVFVFCFTSAHWMF